MKEQRGGMVLFAVACALVMSSAFLNAQNATTTPLAPPKKSADTAGNKDKVLTTPVVNMATLVLLPDAETAFPPLPNLVQQTPSKGAHSPDLHCPTVDFRNWRNWQDVGRGMSRAPVCYLFQNWQEHPDMALKSGTVAIAHFNNYLIVYAELMDDDMYNIVQQDNVEACHSGDIFEIFLRAENQQGYLEYHATPDGYTWQAQWPDDKAVHEMAKHPEWASAFAGKVAAKCRTLIQEDKKMWRVLMIIPLNEVESKPADQLSRTWQFSLARYDSTRGAENPVLSSTSALTSPDFHEQNAWGKLTLEK